MTFVKRAISGTATIILVAVLLAFVAFAALTVKGYKAEVVTSGSMSPMLERGYLIFAKPTPPSQLKKGQVITFQDPTRDNRLVTHRITKVTQSAQGPVFQTKGDANQTRDPWDLRIKNQAGVYTTKVPYVGNLSFLVRSRDGFIILLGIPLILLVAFAMMKIWAPAKQSPAVTEGL
jgi:signal peptidase